MKRVVLALVIVAGWGCCTCPRNSDEPSYRAAVFDVAGSQARMYGVIDHTTPERVRQLISGHPEVTTLVLIDVPGSDNDPANLEAARLVRAHGLRTVIPSEAVVASGGVDFFLAGTQREVGPCAKVGVHSWDEDGEDGTLLLGNEVPRDHELHRMFLDYYQEMAYQRSSTGTPLKWQRRIESIG